MKPFLCFPLALLLVGASLAGEPVDLELLRKKPITTGSAKVDEQLRQWWKEGTAAGNAGDFYDNRDGDHSPLSLAPFPQMSAIKYSAEDIALRKHWAAQHTLLPQVTFGNSSTSAPAHLGGSNPRSYYVHPSRLSFLYSQYTKNNIYIYPEHRDHDPGHNGRGPRGEEGYGDLYPTNTPYLIISQGSSGSDQPFMRMMPRVLAAFRPEVKKKLTETGLLMPTIQMLLRRTYKEVKTPEDYLTGKAHPSVFDGGKLDELAMVQRAHEIDLEMLPPMVQLRVVEEDKAVNGIDFFDIHPSEVLAYTPCCIARIHRSKAVRQRLVVNADASFDVNKRPLTYTWTLLRGDPNRVRITPNKDNPSIAEIIVGHHRRQAIAAGSPLESNRVDIGVFVDNGVHTSAPAFITFFMLDREERVYDLNGKVLSIAHGMGEAELRVTSWANVLARLAHGDGLPAFLKVFPEESAALKKVGVRYARAQEQEQKHLAEIKSIDGRWKETKDDTVKAALKKSLDALRVELGKAQKELNAILDARVDALADSPRGFFHARIAKVAQDPLFAQTHQDWIKERRTAAHEPRIKSAWDRLRRFGIAGAGETLTPMRPGTTLANASWTSFERSYLEWLHLSLLAELAFPGMTQVEWRPNYVDHRLSAPREWRDVYRYDLQGRLIGWRRNCADGPHDFNHEGLLAVEMEPRGRVVKARTVRYGQDPPKAKQINLNPLRLVLGDTIVRYEYADANDMIGRRAGTEPATDPKK